MAGKKVGVLALQGDFEAHGKALAAAGAHPVFVRTAAQLEAVDGLVIPGGESTTMLKLLRDERLMEPIARFGLRRPIFGTCAGLIVLASEVESPRQFSLGFIDATVERNAYGRQRESFAEEGVARLGDRQVPVEMVYIRAPRIRRLGPRAEVLASRDGEPVMAREGTVLVASFHPELTDDPAVHRYFC